MQNTNNWAGPVHASGGRTSMNPDRSICNYRRTDFQKKDCNPAVIFLVCLIRRDMISFYASILSAPLSHAAHQKSSLAIEFHFLQNPDSG